MMKTLYFGGPILTMADPLYVQALVTEGDRIVFTGTLADAHAFAPDAVPVDLAGRALLPGFIDAHSHFTSAANARLQVSLEDARDFHEITDRIRRFIADNRIAPGRFVMAKGYDHTRLTEQRHPTLALLDSAAPEHPLVLQHASGHVGVVNSAALSAFGITPDTPDPDGGVIGRENGALTGYLEENALFTYLRRVPMPSMDDLLNAYRDTQAMYASYGITTLQEGMMVEQMTPLMRMLLSSGILKLDLVGYMDLASESALRAAFADHINCYKDHFRLGGLKIFLDGSPQGRTAWMRQPYADDPSYTGYPTMTDEQVASAVAHAASCGSQILAHCNGDAACAQYLRAVRQASDAGLPVSSIRPVIIHGQLIGSDQLAQAKDLGMGVSFFGAHVYHWGDIHIRNFGMQRASHISPAASAQALGIPYTFHQDTPVIPPDMMETVWCAVCRRTSGGVTLDEAITPYQALSAITAHAAWQYFEEQDKGRLLPGMRADLVILESDPLSVPAEQLRHIRVMATVKDGCEVYRRT